MGLNTLFNRLSLRSRRIKMELLQRYLPLQGTERVLDIGSQVDTQSRQLLERFPDQSRITAVNLFPEHLESIRAAYPGIHTVQADARSLPFPDKSFDLVYSNAVIEHVGDLADQQRMAEEVRRVGKRWFLTTPNRWYPFEFHARLPLVSWLPARLMHKTTRLWSYNHVHGRYQPGNDLSDVQLLTARQLRALFPDSLIVKPRVTFWPETLVVIGPLAADGTLPALDGVRAEPAGSPAS
ncbi:MAG: class I SAM-dependent methyltransferase [Planctomycetes bacterium]|nr:class I SAM-dependent methyltransferase [Planctomycetota bacterium]